MSYRKILVPLVSADNHESAIMAGLSIASKFHSHCEVLFVRTDPALALPYYGAAATGIAVRNMFDSINESNDAISKNLKGSLRRAAKEMGTELSDNEPVADVFSTRLIESQGDFADVAAAYCRLADLVVFSGPEPKFSDPKISAFTAVLMNTGRPTVFVPEADASGKLGDRISIAWDGSTEAANAVKGAMPFVECADSVNIVNVHQPGDESNLQESIKETLGSYLRLHSISYSEDFVESIEGSIGSTILERATENDSDLLVMGAYGHSRIRERLLGGVTQHVLDNAQLSMLMAH